MQMKLAGEKEVVVEEMIIRNIWKAQLSARVDIKFFFFMKFFPLAWLMKDNESFYENVCDAELHSLRRHMKMAKL